MSHSRSSFETQYFKLSKAYNDDEDSRFLPITSRKAVSTHTASPSPSTTSSWGNYRQTRHFLFNSYAANPHTPPHLNNSGGIHHEHNKRHQSAIVFNDLDLDSASFENSLRKLGFESTSYESLTNLRNYSYLRSIENDSCLDTLLLQLQQPQPPPPATPAKKLDTPAAVAAAAAAAAVSQPSDPLLKESDDGGEKQTRKKPQCCTIFTRLFTKKFWLDLIDSPFAKKNFEAIDSQSQFYLLWLALVSLFFIYNIIGISIRYSFHYDRPYNHTKNLADNYSDLSDYMTMVATSKKLEKNTEFRIRLTANGTNVSLSSRELEKDNSATYYQYYMMMQTNDDYKILDIVEVKHYTPIIYWILLDYLADLVTLIDVLLIQTRIKFLREGLWISDIKLTAINYFHSWKFKLDAASLLPFDLLQLVGFGSLTRFNRLLKLHTLWEFFDRWDRSVRTYVFLVRLIKLLTYFQIIIHFYACAYYKLSDWEINERKIVNNWVYAYNHTKIQNYIYSFLFGLKTASTIGNNPEPRTKEEFLFTAIAYIIAMFLFSLIVGQIRNIIGSLSIKQDNYLIVLASTTRFVKNLNLSDSLLRKVVLWFDYYAKEQDAIPFEAISFLPINLQSDLAIAVYLDLLSKVRLFQDCEKNLLYSLVLKLKPITFMPGDYVCKKGEVGREMYIINKGIVEVIVDDRAVAQMKEGSVFGEISLLSMGAGGNRRTATIVSKGFSRLLMLQKSDLNEVLKNYPGMEAQMRQTASTYLKKK